MHTRLDNGFTSHICNPEGLKDHKVSFGEALSQDAWIESPYKLEMGKDVKCAALCRYQVTLADMHKY